jgi:predicted phage terminase large subunit-like protein
MQIALNAATIEGFSERFLVDHYDERVTTPELHRKWWADVTDPHPRVGIAGPRNHAKSTALNHCYGLAAPLFRVHPFQLKVCKTYTLACEKVEQARDELSTNQRLRQTFKIKKFVRERSDDLIVELDDGYQFRMVAIGADQSVRGMSFGTIRPTLIQLDDIEDPKEVLNPDVRNYTMRWVLRTIIPMGARRCQVRWYGTILHNDSALARMLRMPSWKASRYEACDGDISPASILWPERFSRKDLIAIRQEFIESEEGYGLSGFNMEYRNLAIDVTTGFFRNEDFRPMTEEDHQASGLYYVGGDLAFSQKQGRDYTVFVVGKLDETGLLHIIDERRGRWDGKEVIDEMYRIEDMCRHLNGSGVEEWFIEHGAIKATLGTALEIRMMNEGYLNLCPNLIPTKDKAIRAVPIQARMRARGIRFDTETSWFPGFRQELLEFTQQGTRGAHDDRVDALAWLGQGIKRMSTPLTEAEQEEAQYEQMKREFDAFQMVGRSSTTGY